MIKKIKGKANKYTCLNGNMFSFISKEGQLCLRLSKQDEIQFKAENDTTEVRQYGALMRGYVSVPSDRLDDPGFMANWAARCWDNAQALKPKPTSKRK